MVFRHGGERGREKGVKQIRGNGRRVQNGNTQRACQTNGDDSECVVFSLLNVLKGISLTSSRRQLRDSIDLPHIFRFAATLDDRRIVSQLKQRHAFLSMCVNTPQPSAE